MARDRRSKRNEFSMRKVLIATILATTVAGTALGETEPGNMQGSAMTRIEIIAGNETLTATLNDTPTARDFSAMLPLDLTLRD